MAYPDWDWICRRIGYYRCRGILPNGSYCPEDHRRGSVTKAASIAGSEAVSTVHWADRMVTRKGIRAFLKVIGKAHFDPSQPWARAIPPWRRAYLVGREVSRMAATIGIRFPASMSVEDKAQVRALMASAKRGGPGWAEAWEWSRPE